MMHYEPTKKILDLKPGIFTGGFRTLSEGTTDITVQLCWVLTEKMKEYFTVTLEESGPCCQVPGGNRWTESRCTGSWTGIRYGTDYRCGTGHVLFSTFMRASVLPLRVTSCQNRKLKPEIQQMSRLYRG